MILAAPVGGGAGVTLRRMGLGAHLSVRQAAIIRRMQMRHSRRDRGHCLEHRLPYIAISGAADFFARLVFRFAVFRFPALRFVLVFRAAPLAPALRTVRFFARFFVFAFAFVFFFFAVIGMCNDSSLRPGLCDSHPQNTKEYEWVALMKQYSPLPHALLGRAQFHICQ